MLEVYDATDEAMVDLQKLCDEDGIKLIDRRKGWWYYTRQGLWFLFVAYIIIANYARFKEGMCM